jgi:hypothetical protein
MRLYTPPPQQVRRPKRPVCKKATGLFILAFRSLVVDFSTTPGGTKNMVFGSESGVSLRLSGVRQKASPQLKTTNSVLIQRLIGARFGVGWN